MARMCWPNSSREKDSTNLERKVYHTLREDIVMKSMKYLLAAVCAFALSLNSSADIEEQLPGLMIADGNSSAMIDVESSAGMFSWNIDGSIGSSLYWAA